MSTRAHALTLLFAVAIGLYSISPPTLVDYKHLIASLLAPAIHFEVDPAFNVSACKAAAASHLSNTTYVRGFHVLCLAATANNTIQGLVYEDGVLGYPLYYATARDLDELFRALPKSSLEDADALQWKQPPRFYAPDGDLLLFVDQLLAYNIVYLFEGGQFIWPGLYVGHRRVVPDLPGVGDVVLETLSMQPLVLAVDRFLHNEEINVIVELALPHLAASTVKLQDGDEDKPASEWRTSSQYFLPSSESPILAQIDDRVEALVKVHKTHQEPVQVLRYEKSQKYDHHTDYFDANMYDNSPDFQDYLHHGHKNRMITVFWYMSDVAAGGHTAFPRAGGRPQPDSMTDCTEGLLVAPKKGKVIVFYSMLPDGSLDPVSLHGGCPVHDGVKYSGNKWVWNKPR
ncbi:hypothetical protein SDRG_14225 [Saprolegnia diclina VS20]|uniref:Fe2OG dioxygenase domain-containing protein n=1 Tax=Saprolegnia diclina (strain VS20) TaxID=1156394 RepID=T0RED4_SAPDV|nr:hypothetical protein SDRG_14225 [Saprolegnia diclina VS20]EQC27947.1 hypothetical protein SDRG_14225 [Saprolegnia diclina VS20]|eukprot:XP_008618560.1 hypothetical protein SDRG_14225 [Saprolegnia diclina VS20]